MNDSLQAIFRTILEPLLLIPMPWRLLVVIFILLPVLYWLIWRVFPWLFTQVSKLIFLCVEATAKLLLLPEYLISNNNRNHNKQPSSISYFLGNLLILIVQVCYKISQKSNRFLDYALKNKKRCLPRARYFFITVIILPFIWFVRPVIAETQAGKLISSGVNFWYSLEGWAMTGKWGLSSHSVSPEQFIRDYFSTINQGEHKKAWSFLTPHFQNKRNLMINGYSSYVKFWREEVAQVNVSRIRLISKNSSSAKIEVHFQFLSRKTGRLTPLQVEPYKLTWNSNKGTWMFYD